MDSECNTLYILKWNMNMWMCFKCYISVAIIIINTVNIVSDIDTWSSTNEGPQGTYLLHFPSSVCHHGSSLLLLGNRFILQLKKTSKTPWFQIIQLHNGIIWDELLWDSLSLIHFIFKINQLYSEIITLRRIASTICPFRNVPRSS